MKSKSVVLLSAGLDSTVNFYCALKDTDVVAAVTIDYGQRASQKEIACAKALCELNHVRHIVLDYKWISLFSESALTDKERHIPTADVEIDSLEKSRQTAVKVWVPNRNGLFLNTAAVIAEGLKADFVIPGFNKEEAATFPDNSAAYMQATTEAFVYSTQAKVKVKCYTIEMDKTQIVQLGEQLKVPFNMIWPCYFDGEQWCGQCESCQRSLRALKGVYEI